MNLKEFQKIQIDKFKGLYRRGLPDEVPPDHAIDVLNMDFSKVGETFTRSGISLSLPLGHPVKRMFLATPKNVPYGLLTYDGGHGIHLYTAGVDYIFYAQLGLVDFCAVNIFGKTYVMPIEGIGNTSKVLVWDGVHPWRPALGAAPFVTDSLAFNIYAGPSAGNVTPGIHKVAVSFITDTGFTTRPGPWVLDIHGDKVFNPGENVLPGGTNATITWIPLGGPEVVARQLFVTKADQEEFFYLADGYIPNNTTTTKDVDWFDTDLQISADSLFDLKEFLPAGVGIPGSYSGGLYKYHGRMLSWGGEGIDLVLVSKPGEPESFDEQLGWIQLPTETDGNTVRGCCDLRDVLYFTKSVGIISTQDNLDNPVTWQTTRVEGGIGAYFYGIGSVTASQTSLSVNEVVLMADMGGIYAFNGTIQEPPLTWKIDDVWRRLTKFAQGNITLVGDPFSQIFYCLIPVDGQIDPSVLLVGDYSEGIDYQNLKWSIYEFSTFIPRAIAMVSMQDSSDFKYRLRIGNDGNDLFKLDPGTTVDGTLAIPCKYQTHLASIENGMINVFRALVVRSQSSASVDVTLYSQDNTLIATPPSFPPRIGGENTRQINFMSEKMSVKISSLAPMKLQRLDIYAKDWFNSRPM